MQIVSVTELRSNLAAFLAKAKQGEEIIVNDRGKPIVRILALNYESEDNELSELIAKGIVIPPKKKMTPKMVEEFLKMKRPRVDTKASIDAVRWAKGDR